MLVIHKSGTVAIPSLNARNLRLWVNGVPVTFDHGEYRDDNWRGPAYFWSNYNHTRLFDVTPLIRPGGKNTIAFRVIKSYDRGGTYDRVFLLANPPKE